MPNPASSIEVLQTEAYAGWFAALRDRNARARIDARIRRLSLGNFGDAKPLGGGIAELRIDYGPGYRLYFTQLAPAFVLLLCAGAKSSQRADIAKARALAEQWKADR